MAPGRESSRNAGGKDDSVLVVSHYYIPHDGYGGHLKNHFFRLVGTKFTADVSIAVDLSDVVIDNTGCRHMTVKLADMSSGEPYV